MPYLDEESLERARSRYFEANGFGSDGGYAAGWVKVKLGPIPFWFPNSEGRRRAVRYHDLHHVLTDYETDWTGEAEIGAWEVGSGCERHWAAWYLNLVVLGMGLVTAPRRTYRAFVRGRHTQNLYREPWERIRLEEAVGELRRRLGLDAASVKAQQGDARAFAGFGVLGFLAWAANSTLFLAPFALLAWAAVAWL